jgi:HAD superfamily hydrolase (TIGR01509 family)
LSYSTYDGILFDFDGVLADTEPVHFECWREILAPFGIDLDWNIYAANCIGISDRLMLEQFSANLQPPLPVETLWNEYPRKKELFRKRAEAIDFVQPETIRLVRSLGAFPMAVVTSSGRAEIEPSLVRAGIHDCFRALVCGLEVPNLKPAPDPYQRAAELLNVKNPLVVEDSDAGEQSGRAAGFQVLRVASAADVPHLVRQALHLSNSSIPAATVEEKQQEPFAVTPR